MSDYSPHHLRGATTVQPNGSKVTAYLPKSLSGKRADDLKIARKRVCAYARVSTDHAEQLTSYEAQVDYYTQYIQGKPEWDFAGIYTDEGISATNTKHREGFKRMVADGLAGKFDMVITKSISRFARNTVDSLTTIRELKEKGVSVYFEKESIDTLDGKGEVMLTIMSSLAQEESRSISENVTWGQRKRFADGKVTLPFKQFLGYDRGEDGKPVINKEQAKLVRRIYRMFLEGDTPSGIARILTEEGIPTPAQKKKWGTSTVESILTNEKYKGDAILQKTFTVDFLTKKMKINEGELTQYYVKNSHPAIISEEVHDLVQYELQKRYQRKMKLSGRTKNGRLCFSSRIICGDCGMYYGSKVWHSTSKYRRVIWQCNHKYENDENCSTPHVTEQQLETAFLEVINGLVEDKEDIIDTYKTIIATLTNTTEIDRQIAEASELAKGFDARLIQLVRENARVAQDQEVYWNNHRALEKQREEKNEQIRTLEQQYNDLRCRRNTLSKSLKVLMKEGDFVQHFDDEMFVALVDEVIVCSDNTITFVFKDGTEYPTTAC